LGHPDGQVRRPAGSTGDDGLSLLVTALSLLVAALVVLVVLKATASPGSGAAKGPLTPVAAADTTQAQQSLGEALSTIQQVDPSGQGSVDPATLESANPSLTFTGSPSSGPSTVSVGSSPDGSSATFADRSSDGTCWFAWWSTTAGTWYGAQTSQSSCAASGLSGAPTAGPVSSTTIGWQQGAFPAR